METTATLTDMTPVEVDTILAANWTRQAQQVEAIRMARRSMTPAYTFRPLSDEAKAKIEARIVAHQHTLAAIRDEAEPYETEYNRRPWRRYFLVTSSVGHVHRGMSCTTCLSTTEYAWIVDLADCDEGKMVEEYGENACTVCFPDAPAHPSFSTPGRRNQAARDERQQEKDRKAAEKAAKAITDVDGSPLTVGPNNHRDTYRTKVAARNALAEEVRSFGYYGPTHSMRFAMRARQLIPALRAVGIDTDAVIERAVAKVRKDTGGDFYDIRPFLAG